ITALSLPAGPLRSPFGPTHCQQHYALRRLLRRAVANIRNFETLGIDAENQRAASPRRLRVGRVSRRNIPVKELSASERTLGSPNIQLERERLQGVVPSRPLLARIRGRIHRVRSCITDISRAYYRHFTRAYAPQE